MGMDYLKLVSVTETGGDVAARRKIVRDLLLRAAALTIEAPGDDPALYEMGHRVGLHEAYLEVDRLDGGSA